MDEIETQKHKAAGPSWRRPNDALEAIDACGAMAFDWTRIVVLGGLYSNSAVRRGHRNPGQKNRGKGLGSYVARLNAGWARGSRTTVSKQIARLEQH